MNSVKFGNKVYMNYALRNGGGDIPKEVSGTVLGLFRDFYHRVYVGPEGTIVHSMPETRYEGDANESVDRLMEDPSTVGIAVLDRVILEHLKRTGKFDVERGNPVRYKRAGRTFYVF